MKASYSILVIYCAMGLAHRAFSEEIRIIGPPGLESTEGNRSVPNDSSTVIRTQELWSSSFFSDLPAGGAWLVGQSTRLDGSARAETTFTQSIQLSVSTSPRNTISLSFDQNIGSDVVEVLSTDDPVLYPFSDGSPNPFSALDRFDTPFFYDPSKGDLLLDFRIDRTIGTMAFDSQEMGRPVANVGPINGTTAWTTVTDHIAVEFFFVVPENGDFDIDGDLDVDDLNELVQAIEGNSADETFDTDGDGIVDSRDLNVWIRDLKGTYFGDANLDGEFNSGDMIAVFQAGEYEDGIARNSTWSEGDWNNDGDFDSGDFIFAFNDGGFEKGPRALATVPEPGLTFFGGVFAFLFVKNLRSRHSQCT